MDFHIPFQSYLQRYSVKYKALYHAIRDKIISGDWHRGLKLPSSREMAQLYGVSRGSVNQVYDMLLSEGYVIAEVGRGTFVSYKGDRKLGAGKAHQQVRLSNWGVKLQTLAMNDRQSHKIDCDFSLSGPDAGHFPITDWKRCVNQAVRALSESDDIPNGLETEGDLDLREAVSQYLQRSRGVDTTLDRICIVNGSMQAIALLTQLLVDIGDTVIMEEPGYFGMHRAVASVKGSIVTTGLDQQGMLTPREHAKLAFVTPNRQFPTGIVMSLERRQAILNWASQCGALIMEDDYDSEFRWKGRPVEPLKVLDAEDRVIFVGSFTKTLLPHLRLGYVVLPDSIKEAFIQAKRLYEPMSSACIEQRALALFMKQGHYERHLRRMRRIYSEKYVHLYRGIEQHLSQWIKVHASFCGLHLYAEWRAAEEMYSEFKYECEKAGVCWTDGRHYFYNQPKTALSFGFSQLSSEQMDRGIRIMQQVARSYLKEKR